jgi:hypothetical protein
MSTNGAEGRGRRQSPAGDHIPFQPAADSSSPRASLLTCRCICMSSKFPPRAYRDANLVPSMPRPLVLAWGTSVVCRARECCRAPASLQCMSSCSPRSTTIDDRFRPHVAIVVELRRREGRRLLYVASAPLDRGDDADLGDRKLLCSASPAIYSHLAPTRTWP